MLYYELVPYNIQVKTLILGAVKTNFKMEGAYNRSPEYKDITDRVISYLLPNLDEIELATEVAKDAYFGVTDPDKDRMAYVSGKIAKEIVEEKAKIGEENYRKKMKDYYLGKK